METQKGSEWLFESKEEELQGQQRAWRLTFAFAESMAVKSAMVLGVPDLIAAEGPRGRLSLPEIAGRLSEKADAHAGVLRRIMRFLVATEFFTLDADGRYGLSAAAKWMLRRPTATSLADFFLMENDEAAMAPWNHFDACVRERCGPVAFERAHGGADIWQYMAAQPRFNALFNDAMACTSRVVLHALLSSYEGFRSVASLVDVGGGTGTAVAQIVKHHPNITSAFNFDLPHVIATAPKHPGVEHVAGDLFKSVPQAECMFLKWILHDWSDDDCRRLLSVCRSSLPGNGKLVIVETVLADESGNTGKKEETENVDMKLAGLCMDLVMIAHASGGRERTASEWTSLLSSAGFSTLNFVPLPTLPSVIEAFP